MTTYRASRCPCGHPACPAWHVDNDNAVQGVHFTEEQARMVAGLLNAMENQPDAFIFSISRSRFTPLLAPLSNDRPRVAAGDDLLTAALALNDQLRFHDDRVTYEGGMNQAESFRELVNKLWHERQGWRKPA